jgi:hypothetical protein
VKLRALAALGAWVALWLGRVVLERDMTLHMIVQLPLLAGVGLLFAAILRPWEPRWLIEADWLGIPGLVLAVFASSFWMLPIMLDDALANPLIDLTKFLSLPLLVGAPLGLCWRRLPALGRAFVWANFIPKIGAIGGLYLAAPERLCAYYRLDQQASAGWTLIIVAVVLGLLWFIAAFIGWSDKSRDENFRRSSARMSQAPRLTALPPPFAGS